MTTQVQEKYAQMSPQERLLHAIRVTNEETKARNWGEHLTFALKAVGLHRSLVIRKVDATVRVSVPPSHANATVESALVQAGVGAVGSINITRRFRMSTTEVGGGCSCPRTAEGIKALVRDVVDAAYSKAGVAVSNISVIDTDGNRPFVNCNHCS